MCKSNNKNLNELILDSFCYHCENDGDCYSTYTGDSCDNLFSNEKEDPKNVCIICGFERLRGKRQSISNFE